MTNFTKSMRLSIYRDLRVAKSAVDGEPRSKFWLKRAKKYVVKFHAVIQFRIFFR